MLAVSWNVNGLSAAMKKGFKEFFELMNADIFAIQETKMKENQKDFAFPGYYEYWNSADKAGYSGTLVYTKTLPLNVIYGIDGEAYNDEGRIITLEFDKYFFVTAYVPNSKQDLSRIPYRMDFEDQMLSYLKRLDASKPVIYCGDLNVAHQEIDIRNAKQNVLSAGFTVHERTKMTALLENGFTDTYRFKYPDKIEYTWWSYMFNSRMNNVGWRIDYFVVSNRIQNLINDALILMSIEGSDHCPVVIDINI